jgi:hypothetical protein
MITIFCSSFDAIEFCSGKVHVEAEAKYSTIQVKHLALRCRPQKPSTHTGPTVESGPLTGNRPRHHQKGDKNYLHKLDQQGKV